MWGGNKDLVYKFQKMRSRSPYLLYTYSQTPSLSSYDILQVCLLADWSHSLNLNDLLMCLWSPPPTRQWNWSCTGYTVDIQGLLRDWTLVGSTDLCRKPREELWWCRHCRGPSKLTQVLLPSSLYRLFLWWLERALWEQTSAESWAFYAELNPGPHCLPLATCLVGPEGCLLLWLTSWYFSPPPTTTDPVDLRLWHRCAFLKEAVPSFPPTGNSFLYPTHAHGYNSILGLWVLYYNYLLTQLPAPSWWGPWRQGMCLLHLCILRA